MSKSVYCPHCKKLFFLTAPDGRATARIKCRGCRLEFFIDVGPGRQVVVIMLRSAIALLCNGDRTVHTFTRHTLEPKVCGHTEDGLPYVPWIAVQEMLPERLAHRS